MLSTALAMVGLAIQFVACPSLPLCVAHSSPFTSDSLAQGVRLKSQRGRGGFVENILYENIRIHNVKIGIQATLNYR